MLTNNPIKREWVAWADQEGRTTFRNCKDENDRIEKANECLKELEKKALHYGRTHRDNTKRSKLPEIMMIYLWLLRYMIHDDTSLDNAILFLSADKIPYEESKLNVFHHDWILNNILYPCVDVYNLVGNEASKTHKIFNEHLGYKRSDLRKRFKESILYSMASSIVKVLINNPWPPTFIKGNTQLQKCRIQEIQRRIRAYNEQNTWGVDQDLYTIFLQGIPYMIEKNVEKHWKEMFQHFYKEEDFVTEKAWPPNCNNASEAKSGGEKRYNKNINYDPSMKNFEILLPLENDKGEIDVCNFNEFFTAIRIGNVTPDQLFVRPTPDNSNADISLKKQPKKRTLRPTKDVNYKEGEVTQTTNDNKDEDENDDSDSEGKQEEDKKPAAKKQRTTPRKKKQLVQVKSEEKVKLENDIDNTIRTFESAFDKLKNEIQCDEDKVDRTAIDERFTNMLTCWNLMKMQVENYKKTI